MRNVRAVLISLTLLLAARVTFSQTDQGNEIRCATGTACTSNFIPKFSTNGGSATVTNSIMTQSGSTVSVAGNVSATQLISKAASGTPPLQVSSTTRVPNLNASFVDGLSASAFATLHATANVFTGSQLIAGSVGIGTTTPSERLDLGNQGNVVIRTDPGSDTAEGNVAYKLVGRDSGGGAHTWAIYTAPVGGGFGVPANSLSIWEYPPSGQPGCCLQRFVILPAETASVTGSTVVIDANGNVGIGTTPQYALHLARPCCQPLARFEGGDVNITGSLFANADGNADGSVFGFDLVASDCVLASGTELGGTCKSDAALKKNIEPFSPVLDKVAQLQPVSYDWRAEDYPQYHFGSSKAFGLVAQDVEKVFPEMVSVDKDGFKNVNYSELPYLMLQAIRDLKAENDSLRERVQQLENALRK